MKTLYILLVALFFSQSYCQTKECEFFTETTGVEDCTSRINSTYYRCCYVEVDGGGDVLETCAFVSKEQYDDIDGKIKSLEDEFGFDDIKIDCDSNYIILSLLSLILFLL